MSEHMVEFSFSGVPIYQLKARDLSESGIGVVVRPDSKFLGLIQTGQEMNVKLLSPQESDHLPGVYRVRIAHVTALAEGKFKGHQLVALELVSKISSS